MHGAAGRRSRRHNDNVTLPKRVQSAFFEIWGGRQIGGFALLPVHALLPLKLVMAKGERDASQRSPGDLDDSRNISARSAVAVSES